MNTVFHVAGLTRAGTQAELDHANVDGTRALLAAVRDAAPGARIVAVSSLEAMGPNRLAPDGQPVPAVETDVPRPVSMYGRSKAAMEAALWRERGDVWATVVRPPAVYGPREADIFEMIRGASRGLFAVVGDRHARRLSLVHVRDLVDGIVRAAQTDAADGETYFVGSVRRLLVDRGAARHGARPRPADAPPARAGAGRRGGRVCGRSRWEAPGRLPPLTRDKAHAARHAWVCRIEKARRDLGYAPAVALDDGMAETVSWYRDAGWL